MYIKTSGQLTMLIYIYIYCIYNESVAVSLVYYMRNYEKCKVREFRKSPKLWVKGKEKNEGSGELGHWSVEVSHKLWEVVMIRWFRCSVQHGYVSQHYMINTCPYDDTLAGWMRYIYCKN